MPSEGELQAELDLPRICERAPNRGGRSDPFTRRGKEPDTLRKGSGPVKIRPVEQVESLRAKLDALHFRNPDVFHNRKIEVLQARTADGVASEIAIETGLRQHKGAGIKVEIRCSQLRAGRH